MSEVVSGRCLQNLAPFRNWSLRFAKTNMVVGEAWPRYLQAQGIARERIQVIPNWSDGTLIVPHRARRERLRDSWAPNGRFIVGYAGNLGRAHDVDTIIEAMTILQQRAATAPADDIARSKSCSFSSVAVLSGPSSSGRCYSEAHKCAATSVSASRAFGGNPGGRRCSLGEPEPQA